MDQTRVRVEVGRPAEIIPYMEGVDVMVLDVETDLYGEAEAVLRVWNHAARRLLLFVPSRRSPAPLLEAAGEKFLRAGFVHFEGAWAQDGIAEGGLSLFLFGEMVPVSQDRRRQPLFFNVKAFRQDRRAIRAMTADLVVKTATASHETVLDPFGDDPTWTRVLAAHNRRVTAIVRDDHAAKRLAGLRIRPDLHAVEEPTEMEGELMREVREAYEQDLDTY